MLINFSTYMQAGVVVIGYWDPNETISPGVWITIMIVVIVALNITPVKYYGESEFWFCGLKGEPK